MLRFRLVLLASFSLLIVICLASSAAADHRLGSYPKVRTFSGGYYGPTQAHFQYQRRYGRPWHGQGGLSARDSLGFSRQLPGCAGLGYGPAYGFSGWGHSSFSRNLLFGPGYGWSSSWVSYPLGVTAVQPVLIPQYPGVYTPLPTTNPLAAGALADNGVLLQQQLPDLFTPHVQPLSVEPLGDPNVALLPASTPQARLRSLQLQQHGDNRLRNLDYLQASLRYQDAIKAAADRAEPHYRLGIALAGMKKFDKAVQEFKTATAIDPPWVDSISLTDLLGDDQLIGKTHLKQRVAEWTLGDAYDADRLYLLGTLLYLDGDPERARIMFETAAALVGQEPHLTAFLSQPLPSPAMAPQAQSPAAAPPPLPPLPELVDPHPPKEVAPPAGGTGTLPSLKQPIGPVFPTSF